MKNETGPVQFAHSLNSSRHVIRGLSQACCLATLLAAVTASGEGFRNPPPGAFNLGRSGGRIAQVDDASAIHQNPANLIDVAGLEFQLSPTVVRIQADFTSPTGQSSSTTDPWKLLPNVFLATPIADGRWAFGLGITTPYGIGSSWDTGSSAYTKPTGVFRYTAPYDAQLQTLNLNPGFAVKLGDRVRFGAGLDVMWTELTLKSYYPWMIFPGSTGLEPDGKAKAQGDGFGFGANLGFTWLITDRQRLALTYRSPMNVDLGGDFNINGITPVASALGATSTSKFNSEMKFPTIVALGYGIQLTDTIRVGADIEYLEFSRFDSLDMNIGNNNFLLQDRSINQNWKDTFTFGVGGDWRFAPGWVLRAGYQYDESPVPDKTFSPTIPDANQNVITIGLGYSYKGHSFEFAYGADFYAKRTIKNAETPAFNGEYDINVHLFSAAYRYRF